MTQQTRNPDIDCPPNSAPHTYRNWAEMSLSDVVAAAENLREAVRKANECCQASRSDDDSPGQIAAAELMAMLDDDGDEYHHAGGGFVKPVRSSPVQLCNAIDAALNGYYDPRKHNDD